MRFLLNGLRPFTARAAATAAAATAACAFGSGSTRPLDPRAWSIAQASAPSVDRHIKEGRPVSSPRMSVAGLPPPVRVVTYNVLSSHLCEPDYYVKCDPADLDPATRLSRVKAQLQPHVEEGAVICLQEISQQWAGDLTTHFESHGYTFVTGLYGRSFNGYMGVALAWPTSRFASEAVDITRAADTKTWPPPPPRAPFPPKPTSSFGAGVSALQAGWKAGKRACGDCWGRWKNGPPPLDPWAEAERRGNILLSARLKCKVVFLTSIIVTWYQQVIFM